MSADSDACPYERVSSDTLCRIGGVKINDAKHTSIGEGVIFDSMYPESITL